MLSILSLLCASVLFTSAADDGGCARGAPSLLLYLSPELDSLISPDFSESYTELFTQSAREINYCVQIIDSIIPRDSALLGSVVIQVTMGPPGDGGRLVLASFAQLTELSSTVQSLAGTRPLVRLPLSETYPAEVYSVLSTKIIEDFRTHYLCHLRIITEPGGSHLSSPLGLKGQSPVEWVVPLGMVPLVISKERYRKLVTTIHLDRPGDQTVVLNLQKKRFYNSRLMYPLGISLVASGAFFAAEAYHYRVYRNLGEGEYRADPASFARTFKKAQVCQYAGVGGLMVSGACLGLTWFF